uniref:G-protein coupled receptors family 1 profile domain-containing protein n=1 Tax=Chelonoidis abingdonii TaxID=106734 RepID=A0A8C0G7I7_CHEAB
MTSNLQYCFENMNKSLTLYIVLGLLTILTVAGNLLVIISIAYFNQLHSPTNFLIASLACADFEIFCRLHCYLNVSLCLASIFHLCFISVDRYVAVNNPLIYPVKFTVPVSGMFVGVAWTFSLVYSVYVVFTGANEEELQELVNGLSCEGTCQLILNKTQVAVSSLLYFISFFTVIALYSKIVAVAKRQARMIEIMSNTTQLSDFNNRLSRRERKAAKTLGVPVFAFLVFWSPLFITVIINAFLNFITPPLVIHIVVWFAYSNSAINPLIYSLFYPWFRKAMKVIVSCKILRFDCSTMSLFSE